jgi:hypothetical protein
MGREGDRTVTVRSGIWCACGALSSPLDRRPGVAADVAFCGEGDSQGHAPPLLPDTGHGRSRQANLQQTPYAIVRLRAHRSRPHGRPQPSTPPGTKGQARPVQPGRIELWVERFLCHERGSTEGGVLVLKPASRARFDGPCEEKRDQRATLTSNAGSPVGSARIGELA